MAVIKLVDPDGDLPEIEIDEAEYQRLLALFPAADSDPDGEVEGLDDLPELDDEVDIFAEVGKKPAQPTQP